MREKRQSGNILFDVELIISNTSSTYLFYGNLRQQSSSDGFGLGLYICIQIQLKRVLQGFPLFSQKNNCPFIFRSPKQETSEDYCPVPAA